MPSANYSGRSVNGGRSISSGSSVLRGESQHTSGNPFFEITRRLDEMGRLAVWDFNLRENKKTGEVTYHFNGGLIATTIKGIADIIKTINNGKDYDEKYGPAIENAKILAEQDKSAAALKEIQAAISQMEADGVSAKTVERVSTIIKDAYDRAIEENNIVTQRDLLDHAKDMEEFYKAAGDEEMADAWKKVADITKDAYKEAVKAKVPGGLEMITCENKNIDVVVSLLNNAGIQAQHFYKQPEENGHLMGFIIVPKLTDSEKLLVKGAVELSNVYQGKNVMTIDQYNTANSFIGNKPSSIIDGLSEVEMDVVRKALYSDGTKEKNFFVGIGESPNNGGKYCVAYPQSKELEVSRIVTKALSNFHGYSKEAGFEENAKKAASVYEKANELISDIADGNDECGFIFDASVEEMKKGKTPSHFLIVGKNGIEEYRATWNAQGDKWEVERCDKIEKTSKTPNMNLDKAVRDKILQFSKEPVYISEKMAKKFGITTSEFRPSDKFKENLKIAYDKPDRDLAVKASAQRAFMTYAINEAARANIKDPSVQNIISYISAHYEQMTEQYYYDAKQKIAIKPVEEQKKAYEMLDDHYKALKDGTVLEGIKQQEQKAKDNIAHDEYEPDVFQAAMIDSPEIDEKSILEMQRNMAKAEAAIDNTPKREAAKQEIDSDEHGEGRNAEEAEKSKIEKRLDQCKDVLREKKPNLSERSVEAQAAAFAFSENIHDAIFEGETLATDNSIAQKLGLDLEQILINVDDTISDKYNVHLEDLTAYQSTETNGKMFDVKDIVDKEIRKEVSQQINTYLKKDRENERKGEDR